MTTSRIGLQLYSLRDEAARDLEDTLRRVAAMGYEGVEPFGLTPETAAETKRLCDELNLAVPSVHIAMPEGENRQPVLDTLAELAPERAVCTLGQHEFGSVNAVHEVCDRLNAANELLTHRGLSFGVHNHWWEFRPVDGVAPYQLMLERLHPSVFFELDVYWMTVAGVDPAIALPQFGARAPLLHLKDGPAEMGQPMVPLGKGVLDVPGIVAANAVNTEWLVVELDECRLDMFDALKQSLDYLGEIGAANHHV